MDKVLDTLLLHCNTTLAKGGKGPGSRVIEGVATTEQKDLQGEVLLLKGLDITHMNTGRGMVNWNHYGKMNPGAYVGVIEKAWKVTGALMTRSHLFDEGESEMADSVWALCKALDKHGLPIGQSIEGKVIRKLETGVIEKAWGRHLALTVDPVNDEAMANLAKSLVAGEDGTLVLTEHGWQGSLYLGSGPFDDIEKALAAGYQHPPTGGTPGDGGPVRSYAMEGQPKVTEEPAFNEETEEEKKKRKKRANAPIVKSFDVTIPNAKQLISSRRILSFDEAVAYVEEVRPGIGPELASRIVRLAGNFKKHYNGTRS